MGFSFEIFSEGSPVFVGSPRFFSGLLDWGPFYSRDHSQILYLYSRLVV